MKQADLPNIRHLRAVSLVARHQSVNGAAEVLRLSQPAVSLAIREVEARCGATLFRRTSTGTFPTVEAQVFVARIDRCFNELERGCVGVGDAADKADDFKYRMSLSQLCAVVALSDLLDWPLAARSLGIGVQSVKRLLRTLELLLDCSILISTPTGVVFTDPGKRLARAAKLAIREIQLGMEELAWMRGERSGSLRIGAMPLPRAQILPEALSRLIEIYPDLQIHVREGSYEYLLDLLRNGDVDMMIGALRGAEAVPEVSETQMMRCPLSVIARQGHPLCSKPKVTLADTIDFQWIVNTVGSPSRTLFDNAFALRGLPQPERLMEISTLGVIRGLLMRGDQLTMLSRHQIRFEEEVGKLGVLAIDLPETERPIGASTRIGWQPSRPQTEFMRQLRIVCEAATEGDRDAHGKEPDALRLVHDTGKNRP